MWAVLSIQPQETQNRNFQANCKDMQQSYLPKLDIHNHKNCSEVTSVIVAHIGRLGFRVEKGHVLGETVRKEKRQGSLEP